MMTVYRNLAIGVLVVVLAGAGLYYATKGGSRSLTEPNDNASTTVRILPDGTIVAPEGYTVEELPTEGGASIPAPNYKAALKFDASVSAEVRAALNAQLTSIQSEIAARPHDFTSWIRLGGLRKMAGDYAGAAEIWAYSSKMWPQETVSFSNLGDLYMNFLKDYPKAEANYKQVIALNPKAVDAYANLFFLYRDLYKQGTGADTAIVNQGLAANPGNPTLQSLKAQ